MILFIPYMCVLLLAGTFAILFDQRIGKTIPFSLITSGLILYISQMMFGRFRIGYIVLLIISTMFFPVILFGKHRIREKLLTPGLVSYLIIVAVFFILDSGRTFHAWDELSHWGKMVKEMLRMGTWYSVPNSRLLVHREYPPFMSLIEMMFCRLGGGYSESKVYMALHTFELALVSPYIVDSANTDFFDITDKKERIAKGIKNILFIVMINIISITIMEIMTMSSLFSTIYKDVVLALIFSYAMNLIGEYLSAKRKFDLVALAFACSALVLTKQMGMTFILIIWIYYFSSTAVSMKNEMIKENDNSRAMLLKKVVLPTVILISAPIIALKSWTTYTEQLGLSGQFALTKIKIEDIVALFNDSYIETIQRQTFNRFIHAIFEKNILNTHYAVTYFGALVLIILSIWLLSSKKFRIIDAEKAIIFAFSFTCGWVGYAFTMCILYLFCFSEGEMQGLASYERYMSSFILGIVFVIFTMVYKTLAAKENIKINHLVIGFAATVVFTNITVLSVFIPGVLDGITKKEFQDIADYLDREMESNASVFIVTADKIQSQYFINYYADDINVRLCYEDVLNAENQKHIFYIFYKDLESQNL